jgi:hypothetical protein
MLPFDLRGRAISLISTFRWIVYHSPNPQTYHLFRNLCALSIHNGFDPNWSYLPTRRYPTRYYHNSSFAPVSALPLHDPNKNPCNPTNCSLRPKTGIRPYCGSPLHLCRQCQFLPHITSGKSLKQEGKTYGSSSR